MSFCASGEESPTARPPTPSRRTTPSCRQGRCPAQPPRTQARRPSPPSLFSSSPFSFHWQLATLSLATLPHLDRRSLGEGGWQHCPLSRASPFAKATEDKTEDKFIRVNCFMGLLSQLPKRRITPSSSEKAPLFSRRFLIVSKSPHDSHLPKSQSLAMAATSTSGSPSRESRLSAPM